MPQYVDALFELFGENPRDHFNYLRKETVCHYFWEDGSRFNAPADRSAFVQQMSELFGEDPKKIDSFLRRNAKKYNLTNPLFIEQSLHRLALYLPENAQGHCPSAATRFTQELASHP
jgi:phytoene dehydrogenase-like protein